MATFNASTSALGIAPCVFASSTAGVAVTINNRKSYTAVHLGVSAAGAPATGIVAISHGATAATAADYTAEENKLILTAGASVEIPAPFRGKTTQYTKQLIFKSASGAPMIQLIPGSDEGDLTNV